MSSFGIDKKISHISFAKILSVGGDSFFYLALITYASHMKNYELAISLIALSEVIPELAESFFYKISKKVERPYPVLLGIAGIRCFLYVIIGILFTEMWSDWIIISLAAFINMVSGSLGLYSNYLKARLVQRYPIHPSHGIYLSFKNPNIQQIVKSVAQFLGAFLILRISRSSLAYINSFVFLITGFVLLKLFFEERILYQRNVQEEAEQKEKGRITKEIRVEELIAEELSMGEPMIGKPYMEHSALESHGAKKQKNSLKIILRSTILNGIFACTSPLMEILLVRKEEFIVIEYGLTVVLIGACISLAYTLGKVIKESWIKVWREEGITRIRILLGVGFLITTFSKTLLFPLIFLVLMAFFSAISMRKSEQEEEESGFCGSPILMFVFLAVVNLLSVEIAIGLLFFLSILYFGETFLEKYQKREWKIEKENSMPK